jgi:hypothetical protein
MGFHILIWANSAAGKAWLFEDKVHKLVINQ